MSSSELLEDKTANDVNSPTELLTALITNKKRNNPRRTKNRLSSTILFFLFVSVIKIGSESLKHEATGGGKKFENSTRLARCMIKPTR